MARIVLGIGTSHSPMLSLTAEQWKHRTEGDFKRTFVIDGGERVDYAQLLQRRGPAYRDELAPEVFERKVNACQAALDRLADALEAAAPDVVIIIGDDQRELFSAQTQPAFAVFHGERMSTTLGSYGRSEVDWMQQVGRGYLMEAVHHLPAAPAFATRLIGELMDRDIDVCAVSEVADPEQAGFGHAYGFVVQRLLRRAVPVVPILLNTYYPPNVPSARRSLAIGRALREAVAAIDGEQRVAIVASGGLSHFVVDEAFDRAIIEAFRTADAAQLAAVPRAKLLSGTSETLNWIMTAGAVDFLALTYAEYQPLYRTEAGTGTGAAFCIWGPQPARITD